MNFQALTRDARAVVNGWSDSISHDLREVLPLCPCLLARQLTRDKRDVAYAVIIFVTLCATYLFCTAEYIGKRSNHPALAVLSGIILFFVTIALALSTVKLLSEADQYVSRETRAANRRREENSAAAYDPEIHDAHGVYLGDDIIG